MKHIQIRYFISQLYKFYVLQFIKVTFHLIDGEFTLELQSDNSSSVLLNTMEGMGQVIGKSILSEEGNIDPHYNFVGQRIGIHVHADISICYTSSIAAIFGAHLCTFGLNFASLFLQMVYRFS